MTYNNHVTERWEDCDGDQVEEIEGRFLTAYGPNYGGSPPIWQLGDDYPQDLLPIYNDPIFLEKERTVFDRMNERYLEDDSDVA